MAETKVNLRHLLENIRDSYQCPIDEAILTELIANALDSSASRIEITANAETLKQANAETRKQLERGVFDIETIKQANRTLIETIEESLQIADQGKRMRSEAVVQLQECEEELRKTLISAQGKAAS